MPLSPHISSPLFPCPAEGSQDCMTAPLLSSHVLTSSSQHPCSIGLVDWLCLLSPLSPQPGPGSSCHAGAFIHLCQLFKSWRLISSVNLLKITNELSSSKPSLPCFDSHFQTLCYCHSKPKRLRDCLYLPFTGLL